MYEYILLGVLGVLALAVSGYYLYIYLYSTKYVDISKQSGNHSGNHPGNHPTGNPMTICLNQVISYLGNVPTDVKTFVSTLNSGISLCKDKVIVKMVNDTSGEPDTIITFTNGKPDKNLKLSDFKSGDLIAFRVCSKLDPCNVGGRVDVWITLT